MFDADETVLLMQAAVEVDRHGTLGVDTAMQLNGLICCDECLAEMIQAAVEYAL